MNASNQSPDAPALRALLLGVAGRMRAGALMAGAAVGFAVALALAFAFGVGRESLLSAAAVLLLCVLVAMAISMVRGSATGASANATVATAIEVRAPTCRNVIITASELLQGSARVTPYVATLVYREADRIAHEVNAATLFPLRRRALLLVAAALAWGVALLLPGARTAAFDATDASAADAAEIERIDVTVTPPAYTGRKAVSLRDPERIEAFAGSRIEFHIRARAARVGVETLDGRTEATAAQGGTFAGTLTASADGFIAFEAQASNGRAAARRFIGLSIAADHAPRVRITAPARDLFLPDARRPVSVEVDASDDLALASLRLRYTRVTGSGEQFTFTDGEAPLEITRSDSSSWKGKGVLHLDTLRLVPGDMIVYRGIASDRRPDATPAESDTFIIEITAPGAVAAGGFAIDEEMDRYAVSQQMVILKTERLIARKDSISASAFSDEAQNLAAEQRKVRAEFVFMMGGELAEEMVADADMMQLNEEAHAHADAEIGEGRLANQGRLDLIRAIRSMSHAAAALVELDVNQGLRDEKDALTFLQRTFARNRYILRALTERERLDLARRLTGPLGALTRDARPVSAPVADPALASLRRTLAATASLAGTQVLGAESGTTALSLAQDVLRIDPSSPQLQQIAASLTAASSAIASRGVNTVRAHLDSAAVALVAVIRGQLDRAARQPARMQDRMLGGALSDAIRAAGRR